MNQSGLTMLELLLVISIFALLAAGAGVQLANFQRGTAVDSTVKEIVSTLRLANSRAVFGQDGDSDGNADGWGVRFANGTNDTYTTFYGTVYNAASTTETVYLPSAITFTAPTEGNNADIIFAKRTGTTTTQTTISITDNTQTKSVVVDTSGRVRN